MDSYHVVYDVTAATPAWKLGIAFGLCAVALFVWRRSMRARQGMLRSVIVRAGILIAAGLGIVAATYEPATRRQVRSAMEKNQYQTVTGVISDYTVADPARHTPGHFTVKSGDASHFTFIMRRGLVPDVPLHVGQCVRIATAAGAIGRFEVADTCPPR
jgi:hypothetical protein